MLLQEEAVEVVPHQEPTLTTVVKVVKVYLVITKLQYQHPFLNHGL
jgi:hypothetical protein